MEAISALGRLLSETLQTERAQCAGFVASPCLRCTWDLTVYSASVGGDWCKLWSSDTAKLFFERRTIILDGVYQHLSIVLLIDHIAKL